MQTLKYKSKITRTVFFSKRDSADETRRHTSLGEKFENFPFDEKERTKGDENFWYIQKKTTVLDGRHWK